MVRETRSEMTAKRWRQSLVGWCERVESALVIGRDPRDLDECDVGCQADAAFPTEIGPSDTGSKIYARVRGTQSCGVEDPKIRVVARWDPAV